MIENSYSSQDEGAGLLYHADFREMIAHTDVRLAEQLGYGYNAVVYAIENNERKVVKFTNCPFSWWWAKGEWYYAPKLYQDFGMVGRVWEADFCSGDEVRFVRRPVFAYVVERCLVDCEAEQEHELTVSAFDLIDEIVNWLEDTKTRFYWARYEPCLDLHCNNYMRTLDGEAVLTDPVASRVPMRCRL